MSKRDVDVVVVGGGIGGLASAQALARQGLSVRLLEQSPQFGEVGAGLQIAPNCTRILDQWGLLDEVTSLGVLVENIVMKDAVDGTELTRPVPLRQGEMFNQVAVFQSPKALRGEEDWGTPDEMEGAFAHTVPQIRDALKHMWRDKWWRMFDRLPIPNWINGRVALSGDCAHAPLQYLAQGAVMAIEDAWVLSEHVGRQGGTGGAASGTATGIDWDTALKAFNDVRTEHTRRVLTTGREWGLFWHHDGEKRLWRNEVLRARDIHDYSFVDWLYSRTAMTPDEEPAMFQKP